MEKKKTELPSHVEEVEALRLQVARLKQGAAELAMLEAKKAWDAAVKIVADKYSLGPQDTINFDTFEITRA